MKIIEAMKQVKDLQRKADDLMAKVASHCADMDYETPTYPDQKAQVDSWLASVGGIVKEILRLRIAIQRTNLATSVKIELGGQAVEKTIAEWIHRRRDLAQRERQLWMALGDRGLKEGTIKQSNGEMKEIKIRRYYDPRRRDEMVELFTSEPMAIDARLEVVNAVTDLLETA